MVYIRDHRPKNPSAEPLPLFFFSCPTFGDGLFSFSYFVKERHALVCVYVYVWRPHRRVRAFASAFAFDLPSLFIQRKRSVRFFLDIFSHMLPITPLMVALWVCTMPLAAFAALQFSLMSPSLLLPPSLSLSLVPQMPKY